MEVQVEYLSELSPLLEPIAMESPSGDDPRYDEQFLKIKSEIEKSHYVDYGLIKHLAIELLAHKTKDLRIAGYLIVACGYENGIMGLATAIHVYAHLIQTFWDSIHPRRAVSRHAAVDWLKSIRLNHLIREMGRGTKDEQEALKRAITHLNLALSKHVGQNSKELKFLEDWFAYGHEEDKKISKLGQWVKKAVLPESRMTAPWETTKEPEIQNNYAREKNSLLGDILKEIPSKNSERERFKKYCQIAEKCLDHKRFDLALPILENLEGKVECYKIAEWEPDLALQVWSLQLRLYSEQHKQVSIKTLQDLRRKVADLSVATLMYTHNR
ncbi:MAG: TssA family type VI secretion system protein [Gammaproteobacteria bacterium]